MFGETPPPADRYSRRHALRSAVTSSLALSRLSGPREEKPAVADLLPRHVTPTADGAISRGLTWLTAQQKPDGGFGPPRSYARNVGVCALCGLAFLPQGMGTELDRPIQACTNYLLAHAQPSGFIVEDHVATHAHMYGHGFATTYLAQVYGMDVRDELRKALKRAVSLILSLQDEDGAWRYPRFRKMLTCR